VVEPIGYDLRATKMPWLMPGLTHAVSVPMLDRNVVNAVAQPDLSMPAPRAVVCSRLAGLGRRRRVATAVLILFLGGFASSTAEELLSSHLDLASIRSSQEQPGSDAGHEGDPCAPDCACFCCPGHGMRVAFTTVPPVLAAPLVGRLASPSVTDLHPAQIVQRLLDPPRA
jgi:hypothetical protein